MCMCVLFFRSFDWLTVTMKCWRLLSSFLTKPCFEQNRSFCFICSSGLHDINVINKKQKQMFTSGLIISDCAILFAWGSQRIFEVWNFAKLCFCQIVSFYTYHIDYKGYWNRFPECLWSDCWITWIFKQICSSEFCWGSTIHACAYTLNSININSVVFHFDDFNFGRRITTIFFLTIATQLFVFITYNKMKKYISHCRNSSRIQ